MDNIKNIIFDYGNVIFMIDFKRTQQAFTDLGIKDVDRFFAHSGHHSIFNDLESGQITPGQFRDGIRDIAGSPHLTDEQIDQAWNSLLIGVPPVNHDILLEAKKHYRTFLLSNINDIHYNWIMDYLKREHQIHDYTIYFEKPYYSHLMRMRKPNREIFEQVLNENGLKPEETLFIDDSPQHLKTASELGLSTHLMLPTDSLQDFMYRSGLLPK